MSTWLLLESLGGEDRGGYAGLPKPPKKMSGQVAGHSTAKVLYKAQLHCLNWRVWGCALFRACQVTFDAAFSALDTPQLKATHKDEILCTITVRKPSSYLFIAHVCGPKTI